MSEERKSVCVVVVGDVGRSPRMQYHALSLAKEGFDVEVIGYAGSEPIPELREHPNVRFIYMSPSPDIKSGMYVRISCFIYITLLCFIINHELIETRISIF